MTEEMRDDLARLHESIKNELGDKPQGYVTEFPIAGEEFPQMEPPKIQIVLLDPEENTVAFRRMADPFRGEEKGDWYVGDLAEAIDDARSWQAELDNVDIEEEGMLEEFEK